MTYPRTDYWDAQTPEFRERALSLALDAERAYTSRQQDRLDDARDALKIIKAAVQLWDWIPERGDVLHYIEEGLGVS